MYFSSNGITNLQGLGFFTSLTTLHFSDNAVTTLDISQNTNLVDLAFSKTGIKKLDVSNHKKLERIDCANWLDNADTTLKEVNVSGCTSLKELKLTHNGVEKLNISGCTKLETLSVFGNYLKSLDVSSCVNLKKLDASWNPIAKLDVSMCTKLESLECYNDYNYDNHPGGELASLNIDGCVNLNYLDVAMNKLTSLDVSDKTKLVYLLCGSNQISELDVSKCTKLEMLSCYTNKISILNVSKCSVLTELYCSDNRIKTLNVSGCPDLSILQCYSNQLSSLNLSKNSIGYLMCHYNNLTELDLSTYENKRRLESTGLAPNEDNTYLMDDSYETYMRCLSIDWGVTLKGVSVEVPQILSTPSGVKAVYTSSSEAKVFWNAVSGASGYQVLRSTSATGPYTVLGTLTETNRTCTGLKSGTTYYFKVRAMKTVNGRKVFSNCSSAVTPEKITAPSGAKAASASATSVKVSWNAVTGADGYQVWRATAKDGTYTAVGSVTTTSRVCSGLTTGSTYYFKVRAYKEVSGSKVYGAYSSIVSAAPKPAAPSGAKAVSASATSIKVSWNTVTGATGYQVCRATTKDGTYKAVGTVTTTERVCTGLTCGTTYYFKVRAYKEVNGTKIYGSYSSIVSAVPKPAAPTGVKATVSSSTSVTVSWSKVTGATGYEVFRATSKDGTYSKLGAVTGTSRTCSGLKSGTTYYFKVRAYKEVNGAKVYSAYSTVVNATPKK